MPYHLQTGMPSQAISLQVDTLLGRYAPLISAEEMERIQALGRKLRGLRVAEVNSTATGGGVAELLTSLVGLQNEVGITAERIVIQGDETFFTTTKKIHNALQSAGETPTEAELEQYLEVAERNAKKLTLDHDLVIVHDPQPLPLVTHKPSEHPWVWRCHLDMSAPNADMWDYLRPFVERYQAAIFSLPQYSQSLSIPEHFFQPAIDPFSRKNVLVKQEAATAMFERYGIPADLPIATQISRFDRWKDPVGVIKAFEQASEETPATLVLLGNFVDDDPESQLIHDEIKHHHGDRIRILTDGDDLDLVNALQWHSDLIVQKSTKEGFGLTVTEAMWKKRAVIGGDTDGIRSQITDGENGYLVGSVEECAARLVELLSDPAERKRVGEAGHETVRQKFLMTRLLREQLEMMAGLLGV